MLFNESYLIAIQNREILLLYDTVHYIVKIANICKVRLSEVIENVRGRLILRSCHKTIVYDAGFYSNTAIKQSFRVQQNLINDLIRRLNIHLINFLGFLTSKVQDI